MCNNVGLLDEEEKNALIGKQYAKGKYFTPEQDADGNWILPMHQITGCTNTEFWWVKHLEIIKHKPMDKSVLPDIAALSGLFLFTGAELSIENAIFEIISKFGVVAVLWFWLREMKGQMKEQMKSFTDETTELRKEHKDTILTFDNLHKEHQQQLKQQLESKDEMIKQLQKKNT